VTSSTGGTGGGQAGCPSNGTACVILPLGDSITWADLPPGGGYRVELFHQTLANNQLITFVGSQTNGPDTVDGKPFPRSSEGHSGYTIDTGGGRIGISTVVDASLATYRPNVVLLMIGTNDVDLSLDLTNVANRLGALLDRIIDAAPNAMVVVAKITPTMTDSTNARVQAYNDAITALVQQRMTAGKHLLTVDMYAAFTAYPSYRTALLNDNLHPNLTGYSLMGQVWYAAIKELLPAGP
jgi:lysophospholipase L1-like esterase